MSSSCRTINKHRSASMAYAGAVWLAVQEDLYRVIGGEHDQRFNSKCKTSDIIRGGSKSILDSFDDYFLSQCFHLSRQCLTFLLEYIKTRMKKDVFRPINDATAVEAMTLAAFYFYAHGFLPRKILDMLGLEHTSASEAVNVVSKVLADTSPSFIAFPSSYNARTGVAQGFKTVSGIPNVVGVLGCLHVKVNPLAAEESLFLNPLGYHSVMMQAISDVNGNLLSVENCCPGGSMERAVWERSNICQEFGRFQHGQTWVVGGSGLPQGRHMLTPVKSSQIKTSAARRFNSAHSQVLSSTQHVFGCLKTRFQCLHDLGAVQSNALGPVTCIITACCVIHNIAKKFSVPLPMEPVLELLHPAQDVGKEGEENQLCNMEETREEMIEMCFSNAFDEEDQKDRNKQNQGYV